MKREIRIAFVTKKSLERSETFSQTHFNNLDGHVTHIYGNLIPRDYSRKGAGLLKNLYHKLNYWFWSIVLCINLTFYRTEVVYAEFLTNAAAIRPICEFLNIPIVASGLGYDISNEKIVVRHKKSYQRLFDYCSKIILVSEHFIEKLKALGCPDNKLIVSPIGPEPEFFSVQPDYSSKKLMFLGRFVEKKGPTLLIQAFENVVKEVKNAKLIMGGDGELLEQCKQLVQTLKLNEDVDFIGRITPQQERKFFKNCRAYVQHSISASNGDTEGTPVVILEAMASGLPVISTYHAGIPNVVVNGESGFLVDERATEQMAKKMIEILENKDLAEKMGQSGRARVENYFSIGQHMKLVNNIIYEAFNIKANY